MNYRLEEREDCVVVMPERANHNSVNRCRMWRSFKVLRHLKNRRHTVSSSNARGLANNPAMNIDQTLDQAVRFQSENRLREAEQLYRSVLSSYPDHPRALHMLGSLAFQIGRLPQACDIFPRAAAVDHAGGDHRGLDGRRSGSERNGGARRSRRR